MALKNPYSWTYRPGETVRWQIHPGGVILRWDVPQDRTPAFSWLGAGPGTVRRRG